MKRSTLILLLAITALAGVACSQSLKATYDKQTSYIESFVASQMKADATATLHREGKSFRLNMHDTVTPADRDSLLPGGSVQLWWACYTLTSGSVSRNNLVATNIKELANQAQWVLSDTTRYHLDTLILNNQLLPGLKDGLFGVQPLDEGYILFTGEQGFGNTQLGTIPARSALVYQFWIEKIDNI